MLGDVGFRLPAVNGGEFFWFSQFATAFQTELAVRRDAFAAFRTGRIDLSPAFLAELGPLRKVALTMRTMHRIPPIKNPTSRLRNGVTRIPPCACLLRDVVAKLEDGLPYCFVLIMNIIIPHLRKNK
jgi:hypothetical protein